MPAAAVIVVYTWQFFLGLRVLLQIECVIMRSIVGAIQLAAVLDFHGLNVDDALHLLYRRVSLLPELQVVQQHALYLFPHLLCHLLLIPQNFLVQILQSPVLIS